MNKEINTPVKLKIKGSKDNLDISIRARVDGSDAVPLADLFIEQLKARGYKTIVSKPLNSATIEEGKQSELPVPVCPIHNKEMVKRKGQYGEFWTCPTRDKDGNWCKWKPEKEKKNGK
jgi:hypothetical protein